MKVDARYLMTLAPEERESFLKASVDMALSAYEADRASPESERQLTADLETGDFHDYAEEPGGEPSELACREAEDAR